MAQQHLDPTDPRSRPAGAVPTGDALAGYLRAQATEFLRALRLHRETGSGANSSEGSAEAARALRRSARRISAGLHTFQSLLDSDWCEAMRPELAWVSGTLAMEHAYTARLERLLTALHRLSGSTALPGQTAGAGAAGRADAPAGTRADSAAGGRAAPAASVPPRAASRDAGLRNPAAAAPERGNLTVGAAKAGALLDRQLTLARTRAHSTALQALGSSRFHAVADKVAVLASEVPLTRAAGSADLRPLAAAAQDRLADAVTALPLVTAGSPYNAAALVHGLSPDTVPHPQDAPWHQVRLLLRLHRYAREAVSGPKGNAVVDLRLLSAGRALNRHRDASEAAAAAAQAARTPRITPATAYALGVLHADQRHEVEAARFAFQQCWQKETVRTS
ncbi:CHAD domain-containing protein [Streptomyces sp. Ag82_O1-12]|uniref:CHAD domain-containing protein n=1 Tax=unclassified Streptomyces TaxID=2593676 RepID=UPI000BDD9C19|nr:MULTISPECIES: CHAD domain-containing protein [unclassified Streptomyces]SMQ17316.1 CHAD domain-containing protein [Streptomyces sp. Ag82_O1-12]SOD46350.1 CHAD domain-containing protein [Streptomyces sp. Ag82_G6-1]